MGCTNYSMKYNRQEVELNLQSLQETTYIQVNRNNEVRDNEAKSDILSFDRIKVFI